MPPPLPRPHCTRLSTSPHPYSVHFPNAIVNQYLHSFIPYTGKLWNSLPRSVFPPVCDLNSFKMYIGPLPLASISPTVLFTDSGDKPDFFLTYFYCLLAFTLLM